MGTGTGKACCTEDLGQDWLAWADVGDQARVMKKAGGRVAGTEKVVTSVQEGKTAGSSWTNRRG